MLFSFECKWMGVVIVDGDKEYVYMKGVID